LPVVRFSRDRHGYEHTYLVDITTRGGKSFSRLLYWFRTPPGVKVGREPFDPATRRALESQYPSIAFDWPAIMSTSMPAPTIDWRSRRRADRAAKAALKAADALEDLASGDERAGESSVVEEEESARSDRFDVEPADEGAPQFPELESGSVVDESRSEPEFWSEPGSGNEPAESQSDVESAAGTTPSPGAERRHRSRRRRRRGGRHHRKPTRPEDQLDGNSGPVAPQSEIAASATGPPSKAEGGDGEGSRGED
jgi:hypothetical protein